jgi:serine/threonine-protein phosphatase 2A activator
MSADHSNQPQASTSYLPPTKHILSPAHLAAFKRSSTHHEITQFIDDLNTSIVGKKISDMVKGTEVSERLESS